MIAINTWRCDLYTSDALINRAFVVMQLDGGPGVTKTGETVAARACFASISQSPSWPCAASLGLPRAGSFQRRQPISAHWEPDRRAASTCRRPSKSECHAPRSPAVSPLPQHQGLPVNPWPTRSPSFLALHRQSYRRGAGTAERWAA